MQKGVFDLDFAAVIGKGLDQAMQDYGALFEIGTDDVVPKEDQIKCAIYSAATAAGYLVHVEGARMRNKGRLDLKLIAPDEKPRTSAAIEIKIAWAGRPGDGWDNSGQLQTWIKDLVNLQDIETPGLVARYFALAFAYQEKFDTTVRRKIEELKSMPAVSAISASSKPVAIPMSTGLEQIEYFLFSVAPEPRIRIAA
jgi:hypothetical protein